MLVVIPVFRQYFKIVLILQGDGRYLISNSKDQTIKLWDMRKFASKDSVRVCCNLLQGNLSFILKNQ